MNNAELWQAVEQHFKGGYGWLAHLLTNRWLDHVIAEHGPFSHEPCLVDAHPIDELANTPEFVPPDRAEFDEIIADAIIARDELTGRQSLIPLRGLDDDFAVERERDRACFSHGDRQFEQQRRALFGR